MASRERPPMTFEEAMEKAARDKARGAPDDRASIEQRKAAGIPSHYHVEVYLQMPLEGASHYDTTFKAPPPEFYAEMQAGCAGAPSGPRAHDGVSPQRIPFEGRSHTKSTFAPPPMEAYRQAIANDDAAGVRQESLKEPSLPSLPFEGQSHYAQTFVRHRAPSPEPSPGAPSPSTRHPIESDEADVKQAWDKRPVQAFQGASSAHLHYPPPPPEAYVQMAHQVQAANQKAGGAPLPCVPFLGRTTNQDMYPARSPTLPAETPPPRAASPAAGRPTKEDRDFATSYASNYVAHALAQVSVDAVGRLRVILPKHGTVGDLQDVLYAQTQIPVPYQRLVRGSTGQGLQVRSQLLVDSLDWKSGEEVILKCA